MNTVKDESDFTELEWSKKRVTKQKSKSRMLSMPNDGIECFDLKVGYVIETPN